MSTRDERTNDIAKAAEAFAKKHNCNLEVDILPCGCEHYVCYKDYDSFEPGSETSKPNVMTVGAFIVPCDVPVPEPIATAA